MQEWATHSHSPGQSALGMKNENSEINTVGKDRLTTFLLSGCAERSLFHTTGIGNTAQEARTAACRTAELQLH